MEEPTILLNENEEIRKCEESFLYFCENYIKVKSPREGLIKLKLYDFQKRYIKALEENKKIAAVKFRQGGFTTITLSWLMWRFLFKSKESIVVISKTHKEALRLSYFVQDIFHLLPAFLKTKQIFLNPTILNNLSDGGKMNFCTPSMYRGISSNYVFVDEAAFIDNLDEINICNQSNNCIVVSTPNKNEGWFYDLIKSISSDKNDFYLFESSYLECPEYQDGNKIKEYKKFLSEDGFKQEILGEFLDKSDCKSQINSEVDEPEKKKSDGVDYNKDFWCNISAEEETKILKECRKKAKNKESHIFTNKDPIKLSGENDPAANIDLSYFERPQKFTSYYWSDLSEEISDENISLFEDYSTEECIEKKRQNFKELEFRINDNENQEELLRIAGFSFKNDNKESEISSTNDNISEIILNKLKEYEFCSENIDFNFSNKKFCLGEIETNINEFDVCCLYQGLSSFTSQEKAVNKICDILYKKIKPLFGVKKCQ